MISECTTYTVFVFRAPFHGCLLHFCLWCSYVHSSTVHRWTIVLLDIRHQSSCPLWDQYIYISVFAAVFMKIDQFVMMISGHIIERKISWILDLGWTWPSDLLPIYEAKLLDNMHISALTLLDLDTLTSLLVSEAKALKYDLAVSSTMALSYSDLDLLI